MPALQNELKRGNKGDDPRTMCSPDGVGSSNTVKETQKGLFLETIQKFPNFIQLLGCGLMVFLNPKVPEP